MRISMEVSEEKRVSVGSWWATSPEFVVSTLREQLDAAQSVWPELKDYTLQKRRVRNRASAVQENGK
jgi:hypothetical protein